jgi:hypothetical protein
MAPKWGLASSLSKKSGRSLRNLEGRDHILSYCTIAMAGAFRVVLD